MPQATLGGGVIESKLKIRRTGMAHSDEDRVDDDIMPTTLSENN